jgi:hypothetical protein
LTSFKLYLIRKHSPATGSGHQTKVNTLNKSLLEQKIKKETIDKYSNQTLGAF